MNYLIISDLQCPAWIPDSPEFLTAVANEINADSVLCVGDEFDATSLSRSFKPNPNASGPKDEFLETKEQLDILESHFPTLYLCYSNHGARLWKKAHDAGIPNEWIRNPKEAFDKPNWHWAPDWWIEWELGKVCVTHGDRKKGAFNYAKTLGASVFSGHQHSMFGIQFQNSRHSVIFGCDVGCLCDVNHPALAYSKESPLGQMLGCAVIHNGWPKIVPYVAGQDGKWNGKIIL